MDTEIVAGVFGLGGAIIGVAGTALAQWQGGRSERVRLAHDRTARVNAQAIAVFREFLEAGKRVERLGEMREARAVPSEDDIRGATDRMWLAFQEVSIFCPPEIAIPAKAFADALQHVIWHVPRGSVDNYLREPRGALFDAAGPIFRESSA